MFGCGISTEKKERITEVLGLLWGSPELVEAGDESRRRAMVTAPNARRSDVEKATYEDTAADVVASFSSTINPRGYRNCVLEIDGGGRSLEIKVLKYDLGLGVEFSSHEYL